MIDSFSLMKLAHQVAAFGRNNCFPNPKVGAVLLDESGTILKCGWHEQQGGAHAEINALRHTKQGKVLFVSLEPCSHFGKTPPCATSLIEKGISTLYFASYDPNPEVLGKGVEILEDNKVKVIQVKGFAKEAYLLNAGFYQSQVHKRPWIEIKIAQDSSKRIACGSGKAPIFTSAAAQNYTQFLRSQVDAVLTTAKTIQEDNPLLSLRSGDYPINQFKQPKLIILDTSLSSPPDSRVFADSTRGIILVYCQEKQHSKSEYPENCQFLKVGKNQESIDLTQAFVSLGEHKIQSVLVEAGSQLSSSLLHNNLCDRLHVYTHSDKIESGKTQESTLQSYQPDMRKLQEQRFLGRSFYQNYCLDPLGLQGKVQKLCEAAPEM